MKHKAVDTLQILIKLAIFAIAINSLFYLQNQKGNKRGNLQ